MRFNETIDRRSILSGAGTLAAGVALGSQRAAAQQATKINLVALPTHPGFPIWAARELGFYKEEGIEVGTLTFFPSGPAAVAAGYAGAWDAGYLGGPPTISAGVKFGLLVAGLDNVQDRNYGVYVRKNVSADTNLATFLPGKTALTAVGSNMQYFLDACLTKYGVKPSSVSKVNVAPPNIVTAAEGGQGDIISEWYPFTDAIMKTGNYRALCDNNADAKINTYDFYVIRPDFAKKNPKAAVGFIRAVYRVNDLLRDKRQEMLPLAKKYFNETGLKLTDDQISGGFDVQRYPSIADTLQRFQSGEVKEALLATSRFLVEIGSLEKTPDINFITTDYLKQALAK